MDSVAPEDVADALELIAKSLITLKLALLGYSAIKGIAGIFSTIRSFLAIFGIGGSAATTAATMDTVATAATGLSTALTHLRTGSRGTALHRSQTTQSPCRENWQR